MFSQQRQIQHFRHMCDIYRANSSKHPNKNGEDSLSIEKATRFRGVNINYTLRENCANTKFFLVRIFLYSVLIQENTDQKKLRIWTLFTQWQARRNEKTIWGRARSSSKDVDQENALIKEYLLIEEVGNLNSQHQQTSVKELFGVNSQTFRISKLNGALRPWFFKTVTDQTVIFSIKIFIISLTLNWI